MEHHRKEAFARLRGTDIVRGNHDVRRVLIESALESIQYAWLISSYIVQTWRRPHLILALSSAWVVLYTLALTVSALKGCVAFATEFYFSTEAREVYHFRINICTCVHTCARLNCFVCRLVQVNFHLCFAHVFAYRWLSLPLSASLAWAHSSSRAFAWF